MTKRGAETFGARLVSARRATGLSQQAVADRIVPASPDGTHRRQTVYEWEKGQREPSLVDLTRLCALYEVSADWLLLPHGPLPRSMAGKAGRPSALQDGGVPSDGSYQRALGLLRALTSRADIGKMGPDPLHAAVAAFRAGLGQAQPPGVRTAWRDLLETLAAAGVFYEGKVEGGAPREPGSGAGDVIDLPRDRPTLPGSSKKT